MKVDLVVRNARLVSPGGIVEGGVAVEGGVIVAVARRASIATDHAPYSKERKREGLTDIFAAPNGMPGLETFVHLMLNGVNEGWITLERVAEVTSENPAKIYGIYPKKGAIQPGSDADMVIVDMKREVKITNDDQITACSGRRTTA